MPNRNPEINRANIRRNQAARNQKANEAAKRDGLTITDKKTRKRRTPTGGEAFTKWKNGEFAMIKTKTLVALGALLRELEWGMYYTDDHFGECPRCKGIKPRHAPDCELAALLKLLPKEREEE